MKRASRGGRRSFQDRALPASATYEKPKPPAELSDLEQYVWRNMVEVCPPGWFTPDLYPVFQQFCSVAVWKKQLETTWRANDFQFKDGGVEYERACKTLLQTARNLRLTLSARRMRPSKAAKLIRDHATKTESTWDEGEKEDHQEAA